MRKSIVVSTVGILAMAMPAAFASDFPALISKVPGSANAIMVVDVDAVLGSEIAAKSGWGKRFSDGSADRPLYLPPEADKVVVGAQFDVVRSFSQTWEVAVMGMKEPFSMSLVARAEGGHVDSINGVNVAWVPSDAYFVEVDSKTLGLMAPANRQALARWADNAKKPVIGQISSYLMKASEGIGSGKQAIIAIDTENAIQPHRVRAYLKESETGKNLDIESTTALISSLQGITFEISFASDVTAVARIDFGVPVTLSEAAAKSLVLGAMDTMGMSLPETENWKCAVSSGSITFSGKLVPESLRRVISLMDLPTSKFSSLKDQPIEDASKDETAKQSLKYFQTVDSLLSDLKRRTKGNTSGDAHWVNVYAEKIDRLPNLHVDEDLLIYGEKLTETLHIISGARKMTNMQGASIARQNYNSVGRYDGYGYGNYNYSNSSSGAAANSAVATADAIASGTSVKLQGWKLIDEATTEIRHTMTKKYSLEF